jgi:hypothetical protein
MSARTEEILTAVEEINLVYHNKYEGESILSYMTDGFSEIVLMHDHMIWHSDEDDRMISEEPEAYRPYKDHFIMLMMKEANKVVSVFGTQNEEETKPASMFNVRLGIPLTDKDKYKEFLVCVGDESKEIYVSYVGDEAIHGNNIFLIKQSAEHSADDEMQAIKYLNKNFSGQVNIRRTLSISEIKIHVPSTTTVSHFFDGEICEMRSAQNWFSFDTDKIFGVKLKNEFLKGTDLNKEFEVRIDDGDVNTSIAKVKYIGKNRISGDNMFKFIEHIDFKAEHPIDGMNIMMRNYANIGLDVGGNEIVCFASDFKRQ